MNRTIDEAAYSTAGISFMRDGNIATFTLPAPVGQPVTETTVVTVAIVDDELQFFPERSAGQKKLLAALG